MSRTSVPGFSVRFKELLSYTSLSNSKQHGLYSAGAEYLGVSRNTFKAYCIENSPPKYEHLIEYVEKFLNDGVLGDHDARRIAAWLLFGDDIIDNPLLPKNSKKKIKSKPIKV